MPGGGILVAAGAGLTTMAILSQKRRISDAWLRENELPPPAANKAAAAQPVIPVNRLGNAPYLVDAGRFVRGLDMNRVTSDGRVVPHWGIDIGAELGTPVRAVKPGRVLFVGRQDGYGNVVHLAHTGSSTSSVYAHLNSATVRQNNLVMPGSVIGYVGRSCTGPSGNPPAWCSSMGPHLHYEVHPWSAPRFGAARRLDPQPWLASQETQMFGSAGLGDFTVPVSFPQVVTAALIIGGLASVLYFIPKRVA